MSAQPVTWAVTRDGDPLHLDAAAAVARARRAPRWGWITVDGSEGLSGGFGDVEWLAGSAGTDPPPAGRGFEERIGALDASDHLIFARDVAGDVHAGVDALHGRGRNVLTLEPAITVVGPDGAPLWRAGSPRLSDLRGHGFEPEAVCAFLAPAGLPRAVHFDERRLRIVNRDLLRALDPDERRRRLLGVLGPLGIPGERDYLDLLWTGVRPRLATFDDAATLLAYLSQAWTGPELSDADEAALMEIAAALSRARPASGEAAVQTLDGIGGGPDAVPRRRRLIRWVLTGQQMAPALHAVWDHLGTERAISRLRAAAPRLSP